MDLKAEKPARGIVNSGSWEDSRSYKVMCMCGCDIHHDIFVEADEVSVNVVIYADIKSPWYSMNRWKQIWSLLTKGYLKHETALMLDEQTSLNYAEALKWAIIDLKNKRNRK